MVEISEKIFKELCQTAERYRSLLKTSPDAVTVTDLGGRITEVSKHTLELHGYGNENELLGRNAFELIAPENHARATENLRQTLTQGSVQNIEYVLLRKDGSRFLGELSASLVKDESGKPDSFIATTRDITARKRAEAELRASEQRYRLLAESAE
ncbi:PAS domain-containing protein, partial [Candidatus Margulisiibacteriota bacterium]